MLRPMHGYYRVFLLISTVTMYFSALITTELSFRQKFRLLFKLTFCPSRVFKKFVLFILYISYIVKFSPQATEQFTTQFTTTIQNPFLI